MYRRTPPSQHVLSPGLRFKGNSKPLAFMPGGYMNHLRIIWPCALVRLSPTQTIQKLKLGGSSGVYKPLAALLDLGSSAPPALSSCGKQNKCRRINLCQCAAGSHKSHKCANKSLGDKADVQHFSGPGVLCELEWHSFLSKIR